MKDLIELISSLTVMLAALAGISAINKWKKERFDKAKIDAVEEYETCLRMIDKEFDTVLNESPVSFILNENDELNSHYTQLEIYLKSKKGSIEDLKAKIDSAEHFFDVYSGYAGNNLVFVNNFYQTTFLHMERAVVKLEMEILKLAINKHEDLAGKGGMYVFDFIENENNAFDYDDYMMMSYSTYLKFLSSADGAFYKDKRLFYGNAFKRIVSAEKMALHTAIMKRIFIKLKIFFMKYKLIGKVLHMTDKQAVIVSINGAINVIDTKGKDLDCIEKENRKNILKRLIKAEAQRMFS